MKLLKAKSTIHGVNILYSSSGSCRELSFCGMASYWAPHSWEYVTFFQCKLYEDCPTKVTCKTCKKLMFTQPHS